MSTHHDSLALKTAQRFLKSVLIIDNEASFDDSGTNYSLDVQGVTCAFAEKGILCSVLKPRSDEIHVEHYAAMVCAADAAVLDWQMPQAEGDDNTKLCRRIIHKVFCKEKGALPRLILIYTGESITSSLLERLKEDLNTDGVCSFRESGCSLVANKLHILFVGKQQGSGSVPGLQPEAGGGAAQISVEALPNYLLEQYANLTDGILPNAAFNALAAIRENTGNLLSLFKRELDAAFIHHLLLIPDLRDGEIYLYELFRDAMYSLAASDRYCRDNLRFERLVDWFNREGKETFLHKKLKENCSQGRAKENNILPIEIYEFLLKQSSTETDIFLESYPTYFTGLTKKESRGLVRDLLNILDCHDESLEQFSRLHAVETDGQMYGGDKKEQSILKYGTIIKTSGREATYYLCIMPACDLVRLKETQRVPFLRLRLLKDENDFPTLCLYDKEKLCKFIIPHRKIWTEICIFDFNVDSETQQIRAKEEKFIGRNLNLHEESHGQHIIEFLWVAKLKDSAMIEWNQKIFANLSRIGGNDFEWLRRHKLRGDGGSSI